MSKKTKSKQKRDNLTRLRYDAARSSRRKPSFVTSSKPADRELTVEERQALLSQARECQGNFALAGFLLDKHIQYMASYKFQCKTADAEFNHAVEKAFARWKRRTNCDVMREFSFDEMLQMIELHRTTDGDVLVVKHGDLKLQLIEGDRIRNPQNLNINDHWLHGIHADEFGRTIEFAVSKRQETGGFKHERIIPRDDAWLLGYRRRYDQRRGVTPLSPVINQLASLYKSFDYALAKEQLMQMLGLAVLRKDTEEPLSAEERKEEDEAKQEFVEDMPDSTAILSLGVGEDVKVIQSEQPSQNTRNFWEMMIRLTLFSLHIPYSFFDGSKTNFYGAEGELNQYLDSCTNRQIPVIEFLNELTLWLVEAWVEDDKLTLPHGMTLEDVADGIQWTNAGIPYWVMFRLVKDALAAFLCGAISPQQFAAMFGNDYEGNIVDLKKAIDIARKFDVRTSFDLDGQNEEEKTNVSVNLGA